MGSCVSDTVHATSFTSHRKSFLVQFEDGLYYSSVTVFLKKNNEE